MKKLREHPGSIPKMIGELKAKQRNTVWPDPLRNGIAVDELLWRGSAKATLIQRIGMLPYAMCCLLLGGAMIGVAREENNSIPFYVAGIAMFLLGVRVAFNSVKKRERKIS